MQFSSERPDFFLPERVIVLGDADLNTWHHDDARGDSSARAIVDRLIRADDIDLPADADMVLRGLREVLCGSAEPDEGTLRQVAAAAVWGLRSYAVAAAEVGQLREALTSRSTIDQAKGILMSQHQVDPEAAFQLLVRMSNDTNVRLVDVARAVVYQAQSGAETDEG